LALPLYLRFFPHDVLGGGILAFILGLAPGLIAILVPETSRKILLFEKSVFSVTCISVFVMDLCMLNSGFSNLLWRDSSFLLVVPLFIPGIILGFLYESIYRKIRKTITRLEVPIIAAIYLSVFAPVVELIGREKTASVLKGISFAAFAFFAYFFIEELWKKTKTK
jgi:quinol-cytochrome oxidoreductase complex cytochrome b subunit